MLHRATTLVSVALAASLVAGCASVDRSNVASSGKKDPFADPGKFENLASGPFETPPNLSEVTRAVTEGPVPVAPSVAITGHSLLSSPDVPAVGTAADVSRSPASAGPAVVAGDEGMTPDGAYATMVRGNERFIMGTVKGEHRDVERRRSLASGQKPHTIVLSCSDSRVPPELIFDQGLGDIFSIRVAGEILGSAQVASIEYAIAHLGAKLVLVLGHESCGAVKAALDSNRKISAGSTDLDWMVGAIKPNLDRTIASRTEEDPKLRKPVMANVDAVTAQLLIRSKIVSDAVSKGSLKIVKGIYALDSGRVDFWGYK